MKRQRSFHLITAILSIFILSLLSPSCATTSKSRIDAQRAGLMMQDKADYSRNKSNFKGSKSYKKQVKRNKRYQKNRMKMSRR